MGEVTKKTVCGVVTVGGCWGAGCALHGACPYEKALLEAKEAQTSER